MKRFPKTAVILANCPTVLDGVEMGSYAKLMLPIANRPLAEYQASVLASAGVESLVICMSRSCESIVDELREILGRLPLTMRCVLQETPRGTGGTLKEVENLIEGDRFWLMSGDLLIDADLSHMAAYHRKCSSTATVAAVREEDPPWRMERVEYDSDERIKTIHRIHPAHSRRSKLRPAGLYLFERSILETIPEEGYFDLKEQLFMQLYASSTPTKIWEVHEYCQTITSLDRYFATNRDILLDRAEFSFLRQWVPWDSHSVPGETGRKGVTVLEPVALSRETTIGRGALLIGPTAVHDRCHIGKGAVLNNCVLLKDARIGDGAQLANCIVGEGAVVEDGAKLRDMVFTRNGAARQHMSVTLNTGSGSCTPGGGPGATARQGGGKRGYRIWKRLFDAVFSFSALVFLSPLLLVIAMAIAVESPGGMIFRQRRCGQHGREFTMFKFRTMVSNAEEVKREISRMNEVDGPMFKIAKDPRVTRVGRILRATNLDEVPQFWNILRGDMAFVGPRPLSWDEMRYNPRWRDLRLSVHQGLIGLWQIQSHCNTSFIEWIHNDLEYVHNRSAWLDFKITMIAYKNIFTSILERFNLHVRVKYPVKSDG